jgi:hypothetical protein
VLLLAFYSAMEYNASKAVLSSRAPKMIWAQWQATPTFFERRS